MREEGDVEPKIQDVLHRLNLPPEDIAGIGDDLEGIERDSHRQYDGIDIKPPCLGEAVADIREDVKDSEVRAKPVVDDVCEEVRVFEIEENA